jgi:hypothetical protein
MEGSELKRAIMGAMTLSQLIAELNELDRLIQGHPTKLHLFGDGGGEIIVDETYRSIHTGAFRDEMELKDVIAEIKENIRKVNRE